MPDQTPPAGFTPVQNSGGPPPGFTPVQDAPTPEEPGLMEKLSNISDDVASGVAKEVVATAGGAQTLVSEALNKIPGIGETLAPRAGIESEKASLAAGTHLEGAAQHVGAGIEQVGEWMAGDAALQGLAKLGAVAKHAPELLELAERFPTTAKLLLSAGARGAAIGGTQAGVKAEAKGEDVGKAVAGGAAGGAVGGAVGEAVPAVLGSKLARGFVNRSAGATARDVLYGNPARAFFDEGIIAPNTGNIETYKDALRAGKSMEEAVQAAGGRIAAVGEKLNEIKPQLDAVLKASKAQISVNDTILKPLLDAQNDIAGNAAIKPDIAKSAIDALDDWGYRIETIINKEHMSALEAVEFKQKLGQTMDFTHNTAADDVVSNVEREIYGNLKNAVHKEVPEAASLDERSTNLMAAWNELNPSKAGSLGAKEEVGAGKGITGGNLWDVPQRILVMLGKITPGARAAAASPVTKAAVGVAGENAGTELSEPPE